jgi:hypothetical protein
MSIIVFASKKKLPKLQASNFWRVIATSPVWVPSGGNSSFTIG